MVRAFLVFGVELFGLREAVLEGRRGAGSLLPTQPPLARLARVGRKGRTARGVVDAQVVPVPVASMLTQPCCLAVGECQACDDR
jgi:hypothetical protein